MIVKNEEQVIERCLSGVLGIADEIIIVDTGSTDNTKRIAKRYTRKVYDFKWVDDFSAARNYSFSHATKDYVMWLDADDVILPTDREKIIALKNKLTPAIDVVMMKYNVGFDETGNATFHSTRERILKRANNFRWVDPVHEYIQIYGNIVNADDICITHRAEHKTLTDRNIKIYEKILQNGDLSPRGKYYYARELADHARPADAAVYYEKFIAENKGWVEDNISACFNLSHCYKFLGDTDGAFTALVKSFKYTAPRAEICSALGYIFKERGDYETAIFWFTTALNLPTDRGIGFVLRDYQTFIPAIELAVCYDKLGQFDKAREYNEIAGGEKPTNPAYLQNKEYFASLK